MTDVQKQGVVLRMSLEMAYGDQFPRHYIKHVTPITPERRAEYKAFKKRWKKARKRWEKVQREGVSKEFSRYGWRDEEPTIEPLEPLVDYEYTETPEEWRARLRHLVAHHSVTGEWLEEPEPNLLEVLLGQARESSQS